MKKQHISFKRNKWSIIILAVTICACVFWGIIRHEQRQNEQIEELRANIVSLREELNALSKGDVDWLDDGYNYLALGNSITIHGYATYWWNEIGMAASDADHDYFHRVVNYLETEYENVRGKAVNFTVWETQAYDRDETLVNLNPYLSAKLDLVTIQLGENVTDLSTYEKDYISLISYIKEKAPNAKIIIVGDYWNNDDRKQIKENVVNETSECFVSLDGITDNEEYTCGLGTIVYDQNGGEHVVEHEGVALHPGDKGMEAIADRIIEVLSKQ
ncbi:SGNH/GDSL hydrolase family protein [Butyrivibrio sp. INlla14]|uniref:SGNH/GDSL hydrolase family protein n=1 Tax=Butyrivibrio sp. INlla14 TaxID=1520808 RepID=UPI000877203E|nr:SGNH/GDSL hydrolase family protein [Butyrivibrio sp. INlla14]SCY70345.1 hypothetical protein SAMN02910371_03479 [Butyrivibrio sp. INlla14]